MTNITEHKWFDGDLICTVGHNKTTENVLTLANCEDDFYELWVNKSDVMAMAKHFGIIQETETDYLLTGPNGTRLRESIGQMDELVRADNITRFGKT